MLQLAFTFSFQVLSMVSKCRLDMMQFCNVCGDNETFVHKGKCQGLQMILSQGTSTNGGSSFSGDFADCVAVHPRTFPRRAVRVGNAVVSLLPVEYDCWAGHGKVLFGSFDNQVSMRHLLGSQVVARFLQPGGLTASREANSSSCLPICGKLQGASCTGLGTDLGVWSQADSSQVRCGRMT